MYCPDLDVREGGSARPSQPFVLFALLAALIVIALPVAAADKPEDFARAPFTVMTRNLYFGFAENAILTATTPEELLAASAQAWADVGRTDYRMRAQAIAADIAYAKPDLVGLQEAVRYQVGAPNADGGFDVTDQLDFVDILLQELAYLGRGYVVAGSVDDTDVWLPISADFTQFVRITDRDVVLVKSDLPADTLFVLGTASGNYQAYVPVTTPLGDLPILRGWVAVDVQLRGHALRFISTHLEDAEGSPELLAVQLAQAEELLAGPAATTKLDVILVGDLNSDAEAMAPTYQLLTSNEFVDTWKAVHPRLTGFTCCQAPDLTNEDSSLYQRIDLVLYRAPYRPAGIQIMGEDKVVAEAGPIWTSDHVGLCALLIH